MTELLHQPGFFGTAATFAADATLTAMLIVGLLLTIGAGLAHLHRYTAHRWVQTSAASLNVILVIWMMILPYRDFVLPGIPDRVGERFYAVTTLHAVIGAIALPFGMFVVLRGNELVPRRLKFSNYKGFMRVAYTLYILTILLGVWVYFAWYVNNPIPPVYQ
jgi:uncharacterized membrane protein YozB (DUF420 family)